jgi:hypothetical protein
MKADEKTTATLNVHADCVFLPVVTSFAENAAVAMGLGQSEALGLTLASEEIFSRLCQTVTAKDTVSIKCSWGGYCARVEFSFPTADLDMRAFNLAVNLSLDDASDIEEMGLLIASRAVDRLHVLEETGVMRLILTKEKKYPETGNEEMADVRPLENFIVRTPTEEELMLFARRAAFFYGKRLLPTDLKYPGKLADMARIGEYRCLLAADREGRIGGGILWRWMGAKTMECLGPYLFNQRSNPSMAEALLEGCIKAIAKSPAIGLINRLPTDDFPIEQFEPLGNLTFFDTEGKPEKLSAYFRNLEEDPGLVVWVHPLLESWLRGEYTRLVFPREIQTVSDAGEGAPSRSVLAVESDRGNRMATMRPLRFGGDAAGNLLAHLALLRRELFQRIFFEMDLGVSWHSRFTPALNAAGFRPRLVLPYAGEGDLVIFQWEADTDV